MFTLPVDVGRLYNPPKKVKGTEFGSEVVARISALCETPIEPGAYLSLHRQRHEVDLHGEVLDASRSELILYSRDTGVVYVIWVRPEHYHAYDHGVYYGYPECCMAAFDNRMFRGDSRGIALEGWWIGTGYMACTECAKKPQEEVVEDIQSRRLAWTAFPQCSSGEGHQEADFLENFCAGNLIRTPQ